MASRALAIALLVGACTFPSPIPGDPEPEPDPGDQTGDPPGDPGPAPAWLHPWGYRRAITLRASQIEAPGDGALVDFPVLVSVTDAQIAASALPTAADIVFTTDDARTVLASEIESFTRANNQLVAWVKVPSLSATTDTTLYVYYGNPSPPAPAPEAVWTADYLAVWHLQQDPGAGAAGDIRDSTSGNHDGTADPQMASSNSVPAQIGRGVSFDGSNDYLDYPSMNFGNAFTISMWVEFAPSGNLVRSLMASSPLGTDTAGFRFFLNSPPATSDRRISFETGNGTIGRRAETNVGAIPFSKFTHVAAVVNRTAATALIYVDGVSVATSTSITSDFPTSSDFEVGQMKGGTLNFPGKLDEVRVASTLRPAEWLLTSFRNQSAPASFHTLGTEERRP